MDTHKILLEKFIREHPLEAAHAIEKLDEEEITAFMNSFPVELTVPLMNQMHSYKAAKCLELIDPQLAAQFIEKMDVLDAELLLRQCKKAFCNSLLNNLSTKTAAVLRQKLAHPADSVGAFMKPMVIGFRKGISVQEAIAIGKREKEHLSSQIYIVDDNGKLEGIVKTHDLLTEESTTKLFTIMIVEIPKFFADTNIESVINHPGWYEFQDIPVIDSSERLIGTLNFKAIKKKKKKTGKEKTKDIIETSNALAELYRIGLTGFLQSVSK